MRWTTNSPLATLVLAAVMAPVLAAEPGSGAPGADRGRVELSFRVAPGWQRGVDAEPSGVLRTAWAATFKVSKTDSTRFGEAVKAIPSSGVAIFAQAIRTVGEPSSYPARRQPLALRDARDLGPHYENQPAPRVRGFLLNARVARRFVTVYIYYGRPTPTRAQVSAAERELRRLKVG